MARYESFVYKPNFLAPRQGPGAFSSTYRSHYAEPFRPKNSGPERSLSRLGLGIVSSPSPFDKQAPSPFTKRVFPRQDWGSKLDAPAAQLNGSSLEELVAAGRISIEEYRARVLSEMQAPKGAPADETR
ncbi:unnamed protein product [Symbiodinium microadriaticum]|nr:unnamed protein product [Symbiodinium microadriaticum]CAE7892845.1 unnamed protein product [Symbiodinium sp. KB8]